MKLTFPIVLYLDGSITVDKKDVIKILKLSFPANNTMLCKETVVDHAPGWILESNGFFRELEPVGKRHEWSRPLSILWNFVLSEYRISDGHEITVGELLNRLKNIKDENPDVPFASDLRNFLSRYDDNVVVSEDMLKAWPI